ncbi:MAG: kelch repeat-containing protein [Planctomycetota bacterium]
MSRCQAGRALIGLALLPSPAFAQDAWLPQQPVEFADSDRLFLDPASERLSTFGGAFTPHSGQGAYAPDDVWVRRNPATVPPARRSHVVAEDRARARTLVFGGLGAGSPAPFLGDTWAWDGRGWTQLQPAITPSPRADAAYAYDPLRQRVVLFGGEDATGSLGDTWEWDGVSWAQRVGGPSPAPVTGGAMGFDPSRGTILLFGGDPDPATRGPFSDAFWEWDGAQWRQIQISGYSKPLARGFASLAHDPVEDQMLLVGGIGCSGCGVNPTNDTWAYRGGVWTMVSGSWGPRHNSVIYDSSREAMVGIRTGQLYSWNGTAWLPASGPPPYPTGLSLGAMVYDAANDVLMRYGGSIFDGRFGGMATSAMALWDGSGWTNLPYAAGYFGPGARGQHAMAYDDARQRTVVFGGSGDWGAVFGDTWEWDGVTRTWTQITTTSSPSAGNHTMAYDSGRDLVVLLEWAVATSTPTRKTWEFDGSDWTQTARTSSPTQDGNIAYDPVRQRTVAFTHGAAGPETWEFNGATWIQRQPAQSPAATGPMTYDARLGRVLLVEENSAATWSWDGSDWSQAAAPVPATTPRRDFMLAHHGGVRRTVFYGGSAGSLTWTNDTLLLGKAPSIQTHGAGCGRGTWVGAFAQPALGSPRFAADFGGLARSAAAALMVAASARPTPLPGGCTLEIDPATWIVSWPAATNAQGFTSVTLPIPLEWSLVGATVVFQGVAPDPGSPSFDLDFTPGLEVGIGG